MTASFKRLVIALSGIFLVALFVINIFKSPSSKSDDVSSIINTLGMTNTAVNRNASAGSISFPDTGGQGVEVRDFLKDSDVVDWDGGDTYVLGEGLINQDEAYQIFYYRSDNSLSIVLMQEPFREIRLVAEAQLLERLDLTKTELCKMNIRVNIPAFASEVLSGKDLGLSFCPGSVEL